MKRNSPSAPRPAAPRPAAPRRPLPPAARRPSWHGRRAAALVVLVAVLAVLWLAFKVYQPFHGDGSGAVEVVIPAGADVGKIADVLEQRGVISGTSFFQLNATLTGRRAHLKPGTYTLRIDMPYGRVLDALVEGPKAKVVETIKVTIPEGRSRREIVPLVKRAGLDGNYLKASATAAVLRRARRLGLPKARTAPEGFLFPATYDIVRGSAVAGLVSKQLEAFRANFRSVDLRAARRRNLTRYDVVTIASMVEREAQLARERPLIAAVIYNRLRKGMPLSIDATIRYADNNWTRPLRQSELDRAGPYNTRQHRGLPPTPIGNPGLASLKAAANPARVSYLFYVVKPGTCGHAFSSTDRQFERDVARYNAARAKNGGRSPTKC